MSRSRRKVGSFTYPENFYGSFVQEELHESGLFFAKGKNGKLNGLVLNKLPTFIYSLSIYDEDGKEINIPWKTYYFDDDDSRKEIEIITRDNKKHIFCYSPRKKRFVEKEDIFSYNARIFS